MHYLDHAATTPVLPEAKEAMLGALEADFGNPSSVHSYGRRAKEIVEDARDRVAAAVGASPAEIVFTGEGGEQFCTQMTDLRAGFANAEASEASYAALADQIAAISPPPELAGDWPEFVDMNRSLANDPSGEELRNASPESMQRFGEISTRVSEYMAQVCGL